MATGALLLGASAAQAQIPITLGVNPTINFTTSPLTVAEWATQDNILPGDAGTYETPGAVDGAAQLIDQASIVTALPTIAAVGTARVWRQHTGSGYVYSQATGVPVSVMRAALQNNSGGDINVLQITYNYALNNTPGTETVPGHRVFWSLSGTPGNWNLIPSLSGVLATSVLNANVGVGTWANGTPLYLMWVDDNNLSGTDGAYSVDNIVFNAQISSPIVITNDPDSITVGERAPASFTVEASGSPQEFHWLSNGVPIVGANSATYTIPSAPFSASGAQFSCIVSNAFGPVTSASATLTVTADTTPPAGVSATASTNGLEVAVVFSEPMNPLYAEIGSFRFFLTGTNPDDTEFYPVASTAVNGNTITLTLSSALTDGVNYSMEIRDVFDTSLGVPDPGNLIVPYPTVLPIRRNLLLIDLDGPNNVWSYSTETNLFGTGWENVGYDDSAWPTGQQALGVNTDANPNAVPIRTATSYPTPGDSRPQFFRRHFFLPASVVGATVSIRHLFEDGAVVYLNGVEAGRFNVPTGVVSVVTRAPVSYAEGSPLSAPAQLNTAGLVAGDNVIAVVVIQNGATSSDSIMALELTANIGTYAAGPPVVVTQPVGATVNEGGNVSFSVAADGALPLTYQWNFNGGPILDATNASYSLTGVLPSQAGTYSVTVVNGLGSTNSSNAVLSVIADTINPAFQSAVGSIDLNTVTAVFSDAGGFDLADLQNPANYAIALTGGGGSLGIASAVASVAGTNATVTITTTTPRVQAQNYTLTTTLTDRSAAANPATPSSRPVVATVVVMDYNHVWRYDETGNDLGSSWKDVGFNDSGWLTGAGFLTFETSVGPLTLFTNLAGGNGSNTVLNLTNQTLAGIGGTNITFYFRASVGALNFDPNASGNSIRGIAYFDDGGVIYVNGSEQMRFNLTNSPTALNYTNLAIAGSTEGAGGLVTSNLAGFAQSGSLVAAEVHQNAMNSSDVAWGLRLEASVTTFGAGCPSLSIVDNGNGTVTLSWTGAATLEETTALQTPSSSTVWVGSARVNGVPFTPSGTRYYRLTCP